MIGAPTSVQVSSTHLYHAVSMIRGLLGVGFEPAVVSARAFTAPLADPLSPDGWSGDGTPKDAATTLATLDFGGRMGLYDFTDNQWWNPLRARRIVIRGSNGEIVDDRVVRLADPTSPVESQLVRRQAGIDLNLEGVDLDHISFDGRVDLPQPVQGHAALRGRHRRRRAAGADRRLGARRGARALPAGGGPAGPPHQPRDRGVRRDRPRRDHDRRGVGRLSRGPSRGSVRSKGVSPLRRRPRPGGTAAARGG